MKKNTRAHSANQEPRNRRTLRLSYETLKVLSPADLARAIGGNTCVTTSDVTQNSINCPHTDGAGGTTVPVH
jgi:hypothetical protein